jgi:hypothetical protein
MRLDILARAGRGCSRSFPISETYPRFAPWSEAVLSSSQTANVADLEALKRIEGIIVL